MINKKSLWFLTLFSLILVLSVYYITMPSELLITNTGNYLEETGSDVVVKESSILVALRIEEEEAMLEQMNDLQVVLNSITSTVEEKNNAFEQLKSLNILRGEEEKLERLIESTYQLKSFVKIDSDQIRIVIDSRDHDNSLANKIIRTIQEQYEESKYITVKFQS